MATKQTTIDYLLDQISDTNMPFATRKMFGEYVLYFGGKVVGLICDNQLFIKPTEKGKHFIGTVESAKPYPTARPYYHISQDYWEDKIWLTELLEITANELPVPIAKHRKTI